MTFMLKFREFWLNLTEFHRIRLVFVCVISPPQESVGRQ